MPDVMIRLEEVTKAFSTGGAPAVDRLSLDIARGEVVVLVGPSGCGKTTTLRMINRLVEPTSGRIEVGGQDVRSVPAPQLRRGMGYVIQQVGLFPHKTIADNIATVPRLLGWDRARVGRRVDELLDLMGLDRGLRARYPDELSGGQRQRVGVARALAADPPVLLMDEPFGAVDPIVRSHLQRELVALQHKLRKTIVFVTHDIDEAVRLGDRIAILNVGGVLEQYGTPEDVLREPVNAFVEDFLGAERGLKRLSLRTVGELSTVTAGAVVPATAPVAEAKRVAADVGVDWVGVLDGDRLRGWVWLGELDGVTHVGEAETSPFRVAVSPASTLREALDALVRSRTGVAVVLDTGHRYVGMVTLGQLNAEITA